MELVERQSIDRVLSEQEMSLSSLIRAKDAVRVGKLLKADWFLLGTTATAGGTNSTVVRLVDVRTGILRDVGVCPQDKGAPQLARELAGFVRESRQGASRPKPHVYLAISAFEDLSLNNRQAGFPAQLRGYLMSAFRADNVTILEREYVDALLQEVQLDLAGLTESSSAGAQPLQSAWWLVTGRYQSYGNNGTEVEVLLNVARIFGRLPKETALRGLPGEGLFREIQQTIATQIKQGASTVVLSRRTEVINQMDIGKELLTEHGTSIYLENRDKSLTGEQAIRRRRNLEEAIRAFQTVIALDPTNRQARLGLGDCLQDPVLNRREEAREQYRQVLDEPLDDKWVSEAQFRLLWSFEGEGPWGEQPWYAKAAAHSANPKARTYFQQQADAAAKYLKFLQGEREPAKPVSLDQAKIQLLNAIQSFKDFTGGGGYNSPLGAMAAFAEAFGTNQSAAVGAAQDLLPELQAKFPELTPYLQAAVVKLQVDTNAPIIAEFQKTLDQYIQHPEHADNPGTNSLRFDRSMLFWTDMDGELLPWCYEHGCFQLASMIVDRGQKAGDPSGNWFGSLGDKRLALALECFEHQQWASALEIFKCYSNRPVPLALSEGWIGGRWIERRGPVLTGRYTAKCEERLGLPHVRDAREFEMGSACLDLDDASCFSADLTGLWIARRGEITHLDFKLKSNLRIPLDMDGNAPFTCICIGESNVWAGSDGAGLIETDKAGGRHRLFTVNDGLLMNSVSKLHLAGGMLWIGYGHGKDGGLGKLDLSSRQFTSYLPSLNNHGYYPVIAVDPPDGPPRHPVVDLASPANGGVLALVSGKGLQQFAAASNIWEMLPNRNGFKIDSIAVGQQYWVEGVSIRQIGVGIVSRRGNGTANIQRENTEFVVSEDQLAQATANARANSNLWVRTRSGELTDIGGLEIWNLRDARWQTLKDAEGLPNPPNTMALDQDELWVGGEGYIARVDLTQQKVRNFCYIPATSVKRIQIGGGCLWAQFDRHLYRASLGDVRDVH